MCPFHLEANYAPIHFPTMTSAPAALATAGASSNTNATPRMGPDSSPDRNTALIQSWTATKGVLQQTTAVRETQSKSPSPSLAPHLHHSTKLAWADSPISKALSSEIDAAKKQRRCVPSASELLVLLVQTPSSISGKDEACSITKTPIERSWRAVISFGVQSIPRAWVIGRARFATALRAVAPVLRCVIHRPCQDLSPDLQLLRWPSRQVGRRHLRKVLERVESRWATKAQSAMGY